MADVLVTGIKIGDMPLKGTVSGNEKLPTGDVGDLAVTPNQIKDFTIEQGNLVNQEQLDDAVESLEQTSSGLAGRVLTLENRTSNINNTSDLDKPVSNATQAALELKADKSAVDASLDLKANKADVYDKTQTYNKAEVDGKITGIQHNSLQGRSVAGAHPASAITDSSGQTQQQINDAQAQLRTKAVQAVESIADLLLVSSPFQGQTINVKSYLSGNNVGGGVFFWDSTSVLADNGVTVFAVSGVTTGRWIRSNDMHITPYHAGAVDGVDSSNALDRFASFVNSDAGKTRIRVVGDFRISRPWPFNFTGQESIDWDLKLTAAGAMRYMIALKGTGTEHKGTITVVGTGAVGTYTSMTVEYGVVLNGVQSSKLPSIRAFQFKYFGVVQDENGLIGFPVTAPAYHNNTNFEFGGVISARDCGCSQATSWSNLPTAYTFSNPVHTGTTGTAAQRTTVTVSDLPYDANLVSNPVYAIINDIVYKVESTDYANKTVALFPWMETSEPTSGSIKFVFGGALFNQGSNSGPTKVGLVDAIRCGSGIHDGALYGVNAFSVTTQFCGFGAIVGNSGMSIGPQSSCYLGFYTESVYRNVVFIGSGSAEVLNRYGAFAGVPFLNCERLSANNRNGDFGAFADVDGWKRFYMPHSTDNMLQGAYFKGKRRNQDNAASAMSMSPANIVPRLYKKNSWTINLVEDDLANRTKGLDDGMIGFIGTGTNGAPTGTFTFNPPSGWTVNGGSSAAFSSFSGPAVFTCYWEIATKNILVQPLTQKTTLQADSTATDVATLKTDFNALLAKLKAAGLMSTT